MNYKDFSINDLMSFVTAYETHNISKCSEILFISRQSVARSISKIENVVGAELFHRSEKGVFPNDLATYVYQKAKAIIEYSDAIISISHNKSTETGSIFAVIGHYKNGLILESKLKAFSEINESFRYQFEHYNWPEIIDKVLDSSIDFAYVAFETIEDYENLDFIPIRDSQLVALTKAEIAPGINHSLSAELFFRQTVFVLSFFNIEQKIVDSYFQQHAIGPLKIITTSDFWFIDSILKNGTQSVLVTDDLADQLIEINPNYTKATIDPPIIRHSGFICKKGKVLSDEEQRFMSVLRDREI